MDRQVGRQNPVWKSIVKLKSSLPSLLVESIMITFGVLLAFAFDSWKVQNKLKQDTTVVLQNLRNELIGNRSLVLEWLSYHDSLISRLSDLTLTEGERGSFSLVGNESLNKLYPQPGISYLLQETAWQTAHSTQVVRYFKYRTTYNLTHCYESHEQIEQTKSIILDKLHEQSSFVNDRNREKLSIVKSLFEELSGQEKLLLSIYRDALIEVDQELTERIK